MFENYEVLTTGIVGVITTIVSGWVSWIFARKKYDSEVDSQIIDNMQKSLDFYRNLSDDTKGRLAEVLAQNKEILEQNALLLEENKVLKAEVAELKIHVDELTAKIKETFHTLGPNPTDTDKEKKVKHQNAQRARNLGIQYIP